MARFLLLAGTCGLALWNGAASADQLRPAPAVKRESMFHAGLPHRGAAVLYDQSAGDKQLGVLSQHFLDLGFSVYDSQGADDFVLPTGKHKITEVMANGLYYQGSGPAASFNVFLYKGDSRSTCCVKVIQACPNQSYTDVSGTGFVDIRLSGCTGSRYAKLKGGKRYFISVQANMNFESGGEWGWNTNSAVSGRPSFWQNPENGSSSGCVTYTRTTTCLSLGEGGDFAFALLGR